MANEVKIRVSGEDRSKPALDSAERNIKRVDKTATEAADGGIAKSGKGFGSLAETAAKGAAGLAAVTGAAMAVDQVLTAGIGVSLSRANAEVALGDEGFRKLSQAAEQNAKSLGLTEAEFLKTGGQAAALAKNLGFSQEKAAEFGATMPDLANKLSILSNGQVDAAGAADQLRSAIAGEFDPLQALGIAINAASVEAEALKLQQQSSTRISKEQATAMAVLSIVQRQTADATKVLATEQGKQAQAAARSKAEMREAWQDLQAGAVPVLSEVTAFAADTTKAWRSLVEAFADPTLSNVWEAIKGQAEPFIDLWGRLTGKTEEQSQASETAAVNVAELGEGASVAAESQEELAEATNEAVEAIKDQVSVALEGRDAARGYQEALDEATTSLKDNGKTLDINTEQGRANSEALDAIARAALAQADAVRAAGGSEADYRGQLERSRADLVKTAERFGMSKAAARAYAAQILGIPRKADTRVVLDSRGAIRKIEGVRIQMARLDGTVATTYINVVGSGRYAGDVAHDRGEKRTGGVWGGAAVAGGSRSGMVLVGEEGPELAQLGAGAFVHTAGATRRMMSTARPAEPSVLEIRSGGADLDELFLRVLRRIVRQRGGNVQVVFGTGRGQTSATL